jgi:hypothetical protein
MLIYTYEDVVPGDTVEVAGIEYLGTWLRGAGPMGRELRKARRRGAVCLLAFPVPR